jgi:hypothetical protein
MTKMLNRIRNLLRRNPAVSPVSPENRFTFHEIGFHGDAYLLSLIDDLVKRCGVECFIETGTNVGCSLAYFARNYSGIPAFSCEPDEKAYGLAKGNIGDAHQVTILNGTSGELLLRLKAGSGELFKRKTLFWLDAHGYGFEWPLADEVRFISENFEHAYILIDDFKVPGMDCFGYDQYDELICSYDYVKPSFSRDYQLFYPTYTDRTSTYHPLRGWGLFVLGQDFLIPPQLQDKMSRADV